MTDRFDPAPRHPSAGDDFREAEGRLFEQYGVDAASSWYTLPDPPLRVRCVEAGAGAPVVLVHGGAGGFAGLWAPLMLLGYRPSGLSGRG